jgi:hypothetical protein
MDQHGGRGHYRELTASQWEEMIAGLLEETTRDADEDPLAAARGIFNGCLLGTAFWALIAFVLMGLASETDQGSQRRVTGRSAVVIQARLLGGLH